MGPGRTVRPARGGGRSSEASRPDGGPRARAKVRNSQVWKAGTVPEQVPESDAPLPDRWTASTVYADMWVDPQDDPRDTGAELLDERSVLIDYLRAYRLTLEMKCAGLDAGQLARRSVPPSTMSLLGLIRHMADVERGWFRQTMAGQDVPWLFRTAEDRDAAWNGAVPDRAVVEQAWQAWHEEVAFAERFTAEAGDLGIRGTKRAGGTISLREVLVHMIEEYARHCGHADLLRERIDGRTGQ
jgi:uncharacterized damage-inducible protein DinB